MPTRRAARWVVARIGRCDSTPSLLPMQQPGFDFGFRLFLFLRHRCQWRDQPRVVATGHQHLNPGASASLFDMSRAMIYQGSKKPASRTNNRLGARRSPRVTTVAVAVVCIILCRDGLDDRPAPKRANLFAWGNASNYDRRMIVSWIPGLLRPSVSVTATTIAPSLDGPPMQVVA